MTNLLRNVGAVCSCFLLVCSGTAIAADTIHCTKCGKLFEANGTYVGRLAGAAAGATLGAYVGSGIGVATAGIGLAATVPLGILGGMVGLFTGGYYDDNICPQCGHRFKH